MIMITTRQAPQPERRAGQQRVRRAEPATELPTKHPAEDVLEHVTEYVFATVNGRHEVHVVRRGAGAWAIRLRGYALHPDGCFWPAPDETQTPVTTPGTTLARPGPGSRRLAADAHGGEPTYPLDEAIARTLQALVRLP